MQGRYRKKEEEAQRKESLLALIPDMIMQADGDRRYIWANQPAIEFFGKDVLGKQTDDYFVDKQDVTSLLDPLFRGDQDVVFIESWQRRKDGQKRLLAWWCNPVRNTNGEIIGTLSTARDITGNKNNEYNLLQKTIELESFFTYSLELLCVADTNGYFHRLSQHWVQVLGYSLPELVGQKFLDFVHPDDIQATIDVVEAGRTNKHITNFVNRYRHKNGSYRWLQWSSVTVNQTLYAAARDITEQLETQEALKISETRYRTLVRNSPIVNYQLDSQGVFLLSEGRGLNVLGLLPGQVVGQSIYTMYKDYPVILNSFEHAMKGERVNFMVKVDGRSYDSYMEPVFDSNNRVTSVIGVSVDQTGHENKNTG